MTEKNRLKKKMFVVLKFSANSKFHILAKAYTKSIVQRFISSLYQYDYIHTNHVTLSVFNLDYI